MRSYFNKDGVQYTVEGDYEKAFHVAVVQMAMLEMTNVNNLPQVQSEKILDDGTAIRCSIVYGVKKTEILTPSLEKPVEKEEPKKPEREYSIERIVPIIMVTDVNSDAGYSPDNEGDVLGFIACMSGTFEGPYQFFGNDTDLPYKAIFTQYCGQDLDETIEDLTPLGMITDPELMELVYLKPTGEFAEVEYGDETSSVWTGEDGAFGPRQIEKFTGKNQHFSGELLICRFFHTQFNIICPYIASYGGHVDYNFKVDDSVLNIPEYSYSQYVNKDVRCFAGATNTFVPICPCGGDPTHHPPTPCEYVCWYNWIDSTKKAADDLELLEDEWYEPSDGDLSDPEGAMPMVPIDGDYVTTTIENYPDIPDDASVETDAIANFCCFYIDHTYTGLGTKHFSYTVAEDPTPGLLGFTTYISVAYTNSSSQSNIPKINVDGTEHSIPGVLGKEIGYYSTKQMGLNYYGPDTQGGITAIFCIHTWKDTKHVYIYCGPNSKNKPEVVEFDTPDLFFKHEIEDIIGMPEKIAEKALIYGEVLLGIVKTSAIKY